jgi:hypothetical protein
MEAAIESSMPKSAFVLAGTGPSRIDPVPKQYIRSRASP